MDECAHLAALVQKPHEKDDEGKVRWDLLMVSLHGATGAVVDVLTHGAHKYSDEGWRFVNKPLRRYLAAACRHIEARVGGEILDRETGLPHLAHACCCLLFLIERDLEALQNSRESRRNVETYRAVIDEIAKLPPPDPMVAAKAAERRGTIEHRKTVEQKSVR